jgi:Tfp pilus assembly protein PilN
MFEFLSGEHRKRAQKEYRVRVLTVFFFILSFVFLGTVAVTIPISVSLSAKEKALDSQLQSSRSVASVHGENAVKSSIKSVEQKVEAIISASNEGQRIINLVGVVVSKVPQGVTLSEIRSQSTSTVSIRGVASTRNVLRSFVDVLKKDGSFGDVSLPVSSLAKQTKIDFSFDLVKAK